MPFLDGGFSDGLRHVTHGLRKLINGNEAGTAWILCSMTQHVENLKRDILEPRVLSGDGNIGPLTHNPRSARCKNGLYVEFCRANGLRMVKAGLLK